MGPDLGTDHEIFAVGQGPHLDVGRQIDLTLGSRDVYVADLQLRIGHSHRGLGVGVVEDEHPAIRRETPSHQIPEVGEAVHVHVAEPEREEDDVVLLLWFEGEHVTADVGDVLWVAEFVPVDVERFASPVDGGDMVSHGSKTTCPVAGASRELDDPPRRRELPQLFLGCLDVLLPRQLVRRTPVVAAASLPPVVVLRGADPVVVELFGQNFIHITHGPNHVSVSDNM